MNKEEISIEQQNKRFSEENPLNAIKRILLCFMSLCFAEGNLIKSFFTRRSKSNKAGEKNSHRNMEPGFKLRNNHYFTIPGHQFILHVVYSPSHHVHVLFCYCTYRSEEKKLHQTISVVTFLLVHGGSWNNKKTEMPVSHTVSVYILSTTKSRHTQSKSISWHPGCLFLLCWV